MYNKENSGLDEHRLRQYNDLKPVTKRALGLTLRAAGKMMKWILTAAWHLPGVVKRLTEHHSQGSDRSSTRPTLTTRK